MTAHRNMGRCASSLNTNGDEICHGNQQLGLASDTSSTNRAYLVRQIGHAHVKERELDFHHIAVDDLEVVHVLSTLRTGSVPKHLTRQPLLLTCSEHAW